ncbi:MFS transporter [Streptomyces microflavus]|uniref:Putative proline/betaine transporter n=2 Tax=Streptomyces microflavus subgroup TaxID=1482601 RepID=A0A6N9V793_STRMI|nr:MULTISPECIES: MFS transporter [Streptomyces]MBW3361319.1 MHS family MFS transporter [Streptomyces sp. 09ZI22]MEE1733670.1 MFS transporter [Streptomyces sp. BE282]NEB68744.1 MHS family MFS transporter [Streptomyces microflavus]OXY85908.1 MFS transporter [Streptomyces sp. 2R]QKW45612.1 MHS family MFS transporter [Streptomyces microflavus]
MGSPTSAQPSAPPGNSRIGRIVAASLVGTTIEWYDFFLYGSAAALVFNTLFFPSSDPLVGTLLAFLTYAVGFAARPLGGVVFGHYGDKIGRKKLLVISLLMMGGATFAMGLLPTHASIGVWAPILLTVLRLVQGFALGGEWGGAVLLVSEHGGDKRRGFWASWPQAGAPGGNLLATGVLALLATVQSDETFLAWGWRIPFLLSGVLVMIGLWIRISVEESPVFLEAQKKAQEQAAAGVKEQPPVVEVFRKSWREVLLAIGTRFGENISYYILTAFLLVYVTVHLEMSKSDALNAVLIGSAVHFVTIPLWGALSDRIGRRPVTLIGALGMAVWAFGFFALLDTESFPVIVLSVTVGLLLHGAMYGPQAAFISEMFDTKVRYSGASMGSQLASIIGGALAPLIAVELLKDYRSSVPISIYLCFAALVTAVTVWIAKETRGRDLAKDGLHGSVPAAPAATRKDSVTLGG